MSVSRHYSRSWGCMLLCALGLILPLSSAADSEVLIRLQQATFDPLHGAPELPARQVAGDHGSEYFLVQFDGPVRPEWRARLTGMGAEVLDYVPDFAYIVRMDENARGAVRTLEHVRWAGPFEPAFRLDRELFPLVARARAGVSAELVVRGFAGEPADVVEGQLIALGAHVVAASADTGGGALFRLHLPEMALADLARVPGVAWIEPYHKPAYFNEIARSAGIMNKDGLESVLGLYGEDQIVAVGDSGVSTGDAATVHGDFEGRVFAGSTALGSSCGSWADDNGHGTHVAGSVLGSGFHSGADIQNRNYASSNAGIAPEALLYAWGFCNDFSGLPNNPYDDYYGVIRTSDARARVNTNSWGFGGNFGGYNSFTRETDRFVWDFPDMVVLFAAGNDGADSDGNGVINPGSVSMPGTAKNVITVGASENLRMEGGLNPGGPCATWGACWPDDYPVNPIRDDRISDNVNGMAAFSSRGPTNTGRIKPDVVAPGSNIVSARNESTNPAAWTIYDAHYVYNLGTSMATPLVAGAGAVVREFYQREHSVANPGAALVKATLINGAADMTPGQYGEGAAQEVTARPDNNQGWGRVDMVNSLVFDDTRGLWFEQHAGVDTGESYAIELGVGSQAPLRLTLAWSDFPGTEAGAGALTNDLDLIVQAPDGSILLGNEQLAGGADRVNNIEGVDLAAPIAGLYTITVQGFNVPQGPQPFALVMSGNFGGIAVDPPSARVCAAPGEIAYTLSLGEQFQGSTDISAAGLPAGTAGDFDPDPVIFPGHETVFTLSGLEAAAAGDYILEFTASDAADTGNTAQGAAALTVDQDVAGALALESPANGAVEVDTRPELIWADAGVPEYRVQVATDAGFEDIIIDEATAATHLIPQTDLDIGRAYFWRVLGRNACGDGAWSDAFSFTTRTQPRAEVNPASLRFDVAGGGGGSQALIIANTGTGELAWTLSNDTPDTVFFGTEPDLDEAFALPDFTLASSANGGVPAVFTVDAGLDTRGEVTGFSFQGTVAGITDTDSFASDLCLMLEAPDGTRYAAGGYSGSMEGCNENVWEFDGEVSADDGIYQSRHDDTFDPPPGDAGEWMLTFVNDWDSTRAATMDWSEVTVTLHKRTRPACLGITNPVAWLSTAPASGSVLPGEDTEITVTVDSTDLTLGTHEAQLCVGTDDPEAGLIVVPVEINVLVDDIFGDRFE